MRSAVLQKAPMRRFCVSMETLLMRHVTHTNHDRFKPMNTPKRRTRIDCAVRENLLSSLVPAPMARTDTAAMYRETAKNRLGADPRLDQSTIEQLSTVRHHHPRVVGADQNTTTSDWPKGDWAN